MPAQRWHMPHDIKERMLEIAKALGRQGRVFPAMPRTREMSDEQYDHMVAREEEGRPL